jgi:hypothetical protein
MNRGCASQMLRYVHREAAILVPALSLGHSWSRLFKTIEWRDHELAKLRGRPDSVKISGCKHKLLDTLGQKI